LRWDRKQSRCICRALLTGWFPFLSQIFSELKRAGKHHGLSAGLLIGGHSVEQEKERVNSLNILVCTPGRLLQHMDETPNFDCSQLQVGVSLGERPENRASEGLLL
jgi:hypothetical protein